MAKFRFLLAAILASVILLPSAHAEDKDDRIPVSVLHTGDDSVGKQFAYSVREALRASKGFQLTSDEDSIITVRIVTLDPETNANSKNYWAVAAVTYTMVNINPYEENNPQTWYPIYLTSQLITVGSNRVNEQARAVMATIDDNFQKYIRDAK